MSNLLNIVDRLKEIAESVPSVNTAKEGNIYDIMNGNREIQYGVFVITQGTHRASETSMYFNFNLFYIDRLVDDLESNRLQVQSAAIEILRNIINEYVDENDFDRTEISFEVFSEKWVDLCAGAYANVSIVVPIDDCFVDYD